MMNSVDVRTAAPSPKSSILPHGLSPGNALRVGLRLHEFEITDVLGEGGFSIVYAARDLQLNRDVAIKEYIPTSLAGRTASSTVRLRSEHHRDAFDAGLHGFINEARLLAQFQHPALVEVLQFWEENDTAYMVMPRYSGRTLRSVLKQIGPRCDEAWLRGVIAPVLDVLEMLHTSNVFHRDIAPDNILIKDNGTPVLLDLGSAREVVNGMQKVVTVVVKPGYAPIEQYSSDFSLPQGPWTDIYAIGALLHFAVAGRAPPASISRIMKDALQPLAATPLAGYSLAFLAAIDRALSLQPSARQQSIAQLRDELHVTADDHTVVALDTMPGTALHADDAAIDDDERTVVVSAEDVAAMVQQLLGHDGADTHSAAPASRSSGPADPFAARVAADTAPVASDHFPVMDDLLSGHIGSAARAVNVPIIHAADDANAMDAAPASSRKWWLPAAAACVLAAAVGGGLWLSRPSLQDGAHALSVDGGAAGVTAAATAMPTTAVPAAAEATPFPPPAPATLGAADTAAVAAVSDLGIAMPARPDDESVAALQPDDAAAEVIATVTATGAADEPAQPDDALASGTAMTYPLPFDASSVPERPSAPVDAAPAQAESVVAPDQRARTEAAANKAEQKKRALAVEAKAKAAAAANTGNVSLRIQPWAEVWVDGRRRGISPPTRVLDLAPGTHSLELRNPGLTPYRQQITVKAGERITIEHRFPASPAGGP